MLAPTRQGRTARVQALPRLFEESLGKLPAVRR